MLMSRLSMSAVSPLKAQCRRPGSPGRCPRPGGPGRSGSGCRCPKSPSSARRYCRPIPAPCDATLIDLEQVAGIGALHDDLIGDAAVADTDGPAVDREAAVTVVKLNTVLRPGHLERAGTWAGRRVGDIVVLRRAVDRHAETGCVQVRHLDADQRDRAAVAGDRGVGGKSCCRPG